MNIDHFLKEFQTDLIQIRRKLHRCAELSTLEFETGALIRHYLKQWEISYDFPIAETGIVAKIFGKKPGKTIALRTDMDALPLQENADFSYISKTPGIMHACGHDAHMAIALGAARYFKLCENQCSGCIKIFFQPAEETVGGAKRMIKDGCMENPSVDYVIGLHVAPYLETGEIEVKHGNFYAASDEVAITVNGKSCHGAYPHTGIDAIVLASELICALQTVISRNIPPTEPCVFSLGTIHGGSAHNVIADKVELTGALRTVTPDTRKRVQILIQQLSKQIPEALGGQGSAVFTPGYDALINTDALVDLFVETAVPILGREHIHWKPEPGMGVEDFSHFLEKTPGVFYHLGCGNQKKGITAPLHSQDFSLDETCLSLGLHLQIALTETLLKT